MTQNRTKGRRGYKPEAIAIHIGEGSYQSILSWCRNPASRVSYHYVISREGEETQLVNEEDTAWHAGVVVRPKWKLLKKGVNPNLYTVGVCFAGFASQRPTIEQYITVAKRVIKIADNYKIQTSRKRVVPHNLIRVDKECPGKVNIQFLLIVIFLLRLRKKYENRNKKKM